MTSTKTIAKIGSKEVNVKNHGQERVHVTAVIWIVANLIKLLRILVFKVKPFRIVEKNPRASFSKIKQIFTYCQKSLENESIIKKWIIEFWRKYTYFDIKNKMLVLGGVSMHKIKEIKNK